MWTDRHNGANSRCLQFCEYAQQMHNSTVSVFFLLLSFCMFRHCHHPRGAYAKISNVGVGSLRMVTMPKHARAK